MPRKRKNSGFHLPDYEYCGPGTVNRGGRPINRIDRACKKHDEDPDFDYLRFNDADQRLIDDVQRYSKDDPIAAATISNIFKAKKFVTPHRNKARKVTTGDDLASNSLSNVARDATQDNNSSMPRTKRSKRRSKKLGSVSKRSKSSKLNRSSRRTKRSKKSSKSSSKSITKQVASILNPKREYESNWGCTVKLIHTATNRDYMIDPHVCPITNRTSSADYCLSSSARLIYIHNRLYTGSVLPTTQAFDGKSFWVLKRKERIKLNNFSVSTQFIKIYYLKCVDATGEMPLQNFVDANFNADTYRGEAQAELTDQVAGIDNWVQVDRRLSLKDCPRFNKYWKVVNTEKRKLEPNDQTTITLTHPMMLYNTDVRGTLKHFRGDMRIIIRVKTEISAAAEGGAAGAVTLVTGNKGYGFTDGSLTVYNQQYISVAAKIDKQRISYLETETGVNYGADVRLFGDSVNDTGNSMTDGA